METKVGEEPLPLVGEETDDNAVAREETAKSGKVRGGPVKRSFFKKHFSCFVKRAPLQLTPIALDAVEMLRCKASLAHCKVHTAWRL
jgi:hypothetical protein